MSNEINEIRTTNEQTGEERASYAETRPVAETVSEQETARVREFPREGGTSPSVKRRAKQNSLWYRIFFSTVVVATVSDTASG